MSRYSRDRILIWIYRGFAFVSGITALVIFTFLLLESVAALDLLGINRFFIDPSWNPTEDKYGMGPMIWGTVFVMTGAIIIATPLGILSAIFINYYAPNPLSILYRRLLELLAGIPSVVYGFWGLVVLVPLIRVIEPPGQSLLAGILILSIMVLPTIALISDSSFRNVPSEYTLGAAALGLSKFSTVREVIFPASKSGVFTGIVLAIGRAVGETMAVLMVCGNIVQVPDSLFAPVRTLTANIALEMAYATGNHLSSLFVSGLILAIIIFILTAVIEIVGKGRPYGYS